MMTPAHIQLIEEAEAANCNGWANCPVDHKSWNEIIKAVRSIVESGGRLAGEDEVVVKREELKSLSAWLSDHGLKQLAATTNRWLAGSLTAQEKK